MGRGGDDLVSKNSLTKRPLSSDEKTRKSKNVFKENPMIDKKSLGVIKTKIWSRVLCPRSEERPDELSVVSASDLEDIIFAAIDKSVLLSGQNSFDGFAGVGGSGKVEPVPTEVKGTQDLGHKTPINMKTIPPKSLAYFKTPSRDSLSLEDNRERAKRSARSLFEYLGKSIENSRSNPRVQKALEEQFGENTAALDTNVLLIAYIDEEKDNEGCIVSRKMYLGVEPFDPDSSLADNYEWVFGTKTYGQEGSLYGFDPEDWNEYNQKNRSKKAKEKAWPEFKQKRIVEYQSGGNSNGNFRYLPKNPLGRKKDLLEFHEIDLPLGPAPQVVYDYYHNNEDGRNPRDLIRDHQMVERGGSYPPEAFEKQNLDFPEPQV